MRPRRVPIQQSRRRRRENRRLCLIALDDVRVGQADHRRGCRTRSSAWGERTPVRPEKYTPAHARFQPFNSATGCRSSLGAVLAAAGLHPHAGRRLFLPTTLVSFTGWGILASMGDGGAILSIVQSGAIWRVRIAWPNCPARYFGKFNSETEAQKWIAAHASLTKSPSQPFVDDAAQSVVMPELLSAGNK